jgi:hypothetical protein
MPYSDSRIPTWEIVLSWIILLKSRRDYWTLYLRTAHMLLEELDGIRLLLPDSNKNQLPNLPSWCPNFNSGEEENSQKSPLPTRSVRLDGTPFKTIASTPIEISPDGMRIHLRGFAIEKVVRVLPSVFNRIEWMGAGRGIGSFGGAAVASRLSGFSICNIDEPPEAEIALLRTLSADRVRRGMEDSRALPSEQVILGFEGMMGRLRTFRDGERWNFASHPTDDEYSLANDYTNALGQVCRHRRRFAAQNGRLGIGPPSVREGDPICLFREYDRLFILRSEPTDGILKVVGETYVHGIMRGELFGESGELREKLPTQVSLCHESMNHS